MPAETEDAIGDHNDIRDGILAARGADVGSPAWWKGVNDAREANDEHMGEEEHVDGVPVVDKDPEEYVAGNS